MVDSSKCTEELKRLEKRIKQKLAIITPAIELCEVIASRGQSALESVLEMTTGLRMEIDELNIKLSEQEPKTKERGLQNITKIVESVKDILKTIDEILPFLQLALITSGAHLSSNMSGIV